jgi:hypothetical protein
LPGFSYLKQKFIMDTNQPPVQPSYASSSAAPGIFGTKIPSAVSFAAGILLFLLPFAEIKCGETRIANKSGLDFALDNEWKSVAGGMFGKNDMQDKSLSAGKEQKGNTQYFIIGALALGVLGFGLSFANGKTGGGVGLTTGVISAGALIGFMLDLKKNVDSSMREQAIDKAQEGAGNLGFDKIGESMNNIKPELAFTPWFYIAVIAFLAAAFFSYKRMSSAK